MRYAELGQTAEALAATQEAVTLYRDLAASKPAYLSRLTAAAANMAAALQARYRSIGSTEDLERAVQLLQQALEYTPADHPNRPILLSNLAAALQSRTLGSHIDNIQGAVNLLQEAVRAIPADHPDRPALLSNLAAALQARYHITGSSEDQEHAVELQRQALAATPTDHPDRRVMLSKLAALGGRGNV
jgi:tetratricopeptide (TPR) repeat protein